MSKKPITFVGARLVQARVARGLTAVSLAETVGVSSPAITCYERRSMVPRAEVEAKLCDALSVPPPFFRRAVVTYDGPIRYRSLAATTKRARAAASVKSEWLRELVAQLERWVELPAMEVPTLDVPSDPTRLDEADIEAAATELRRAWGMGDGPIDNVVRLLESHGVLVTRFSFGVSGIDALSAVGPDRAYVVLNSEKDSCCRSRFDACHEIAHVLLHRAAPARPAPELYNLMEQQAHRFAIAFLFPADAFRDEVFSISLDSLLLLKERWRVSVGAMLKRAKDLGVASEHQVERVWPLYGRRGWRTREPLDDELPSERPEVLRDAYELLTKNGMSRGDLLRAIPLAASDHETLAALPPGFMSPGWAPAPVRVLVRATTSTAAPTKRRGADEGGARVIPLRRPAPAPGAESDDPFDF